MSHTFQIFDGVESTTLDFQATGAGVGYTLLSYGAQPAAIDKAQNSSLYRDGALTVYSRRENIVEAIAVHVRGASADDCAVKLRALMRAVEHARDCIEHPGACQPTYLIFKPQASTNSAYSVILDGAVALPEDYLTRATDATEMDVTVTIEREPYWREMPPLLSLTITDAAVLVLNAAVLASGTGMLTVNGAASTPGDPPALARLEVSPSATTAAFTNLVVGYRSAAGGANPSLGGLIEAETATLPPAGAASTSVVADATASGGNKLRTTFAASAVYINRARLTLSPAPSGTWRVLVRAKVDTGTTAQLGVGNADQHLSMPSPGDSAEDYVMNADVPVTMDVWTLHDCGVITIPRLGSILSVPAAALVTDIGIFASRTTGAGNLEIDHLYLVPVDEYYLSLLGGLADYQAFIYDTYTFDGLAPWGATARNIRGALSYRVGTLTWSGDLRLPPGDGYLYILSANDKWGNTLAGNGIRVTLHRCGLYMAARGNT